MDIYRYSDAEASKMFDLVTELIQVYKQDRPFRECMKEDEFKVLITIQGATLARERKQNKATM